LLRPCITTPLEPQPRGVLFADGPGAAERPRDTQRMRRPIFRTRAPWRTACWSRWESGRAFPRFVSAADDDR
jgi:hypothetical protein